MVKVIQGRAWYLCPVCQRKLFIVKDGAVCRGVMMMCRQCGETHEVIINYGGSRTGGGAGSR